MALLTTALLTTSRLPSNDDAEHADDAADVEAEPVDEDARLEGRRWLEDDGLARHRAEGPAHVVDFAFASWAAKTCGEESTGPLRKCFIERWTSYSYTASARLRHLTAAPASEAFPNGAVCSAAARS